MLLALYERRVNRCAAAILAASLVAGVSLIGVSCSSGSSYESTPTAPKGTAVSASQPDVNTAGDIPDNQVFVTFHSDVGGYALDVPEGWARTQSGPNVTFADKFNAVSVEETSAASAPSVQGVQSENASLEAAAVQAVDVGGQQIVRLRFRADSKPDAVTGKTVKLETDRYFFFNNGKMAALSLSSPVGADNVDAWNQVARSFKWD